jgi:RimJ/RimL family protein N-acetyltransferase
MASTEPTALVGAGYTIDPVSLRAQPVDAAAMDRCARELRQRSERTADPVAGARSASQAALLFAILGQHETASRLIEGALASRPAAQRPYDRMVGEIRRAQVHQFAGRLAEARALLERLIERCRREPEVEPLLDFALQHQGKVFFDLGRYEEARDCFHEALELRKAKNVGELIASTELALAAVSRQLQGNRSLPAETAITFRPFRHADVPMVHEWLRRPHVSEWWHDPYSHDELVEIFLSDDDATPVMRGYIASLGERPIGFIQSYVAMGAGNGWWEDETDPGVRGIDQFLAHVEDLGRGLGSRMIRAFVDQLFRDPAVSKVQIDPAPDNQRAIRSYIRAGFVAQGEVSTPDGLALLMTRERPAQP